jgi:hypothetical protein
LPKWQNAASFVMNSKLLHHTNLPYKHADPRAEFAELNAVKFTVWLMLFSIIYFGSAALPLRGFPHSQRHGHLECEAFFDPTPNPPLQIVFSLCTVCLAGSHLVPKCAQKHLCVRCYCNTFFCRKHSFCSTTCHHTKYSATALLVTQCCCQLQ